MKKLLFYLTDAFCIEIEEEVRRRRRSTCLLSSNNKKRKRANLLARIFL